MPLLIRHPDLESGRVGRTVELLDLYDTVLETAAASGAPERVGARPFEPDRSLLSAGRSIPDGEYGFAEYHRPEIERKQLETKATEAEIEIEGGSRFGSRMRVARTADRKYVRNERFPDEAYRLAEGPVEDAPIDPDTATAAELSDALGRFEERLDVPWATEAGADGETEDGADRGGESTEQRLSRMDARTRQRLRDLGYLE